jgi:predicted kinase
VVVCGPPGSGKTSLAHAIAQAIPCPAVCRDELKEGMVHALGGKFEPAPGDPLTQRTFPLFFDVLRLLLSAEVSVVAEAAFQDRLWRSGLEPLAERAQLRVVHCNVDADVAHARIAGRSAARLGVSTHVVDPPGKELADWKRAFASFDRLSIPATSLEVDTTDGYAPDIAAIVEFVNSAG